MGRFRWTAPCGLVLAFALSSCSFVLDFDELQGGSVGGGLSGSGGSAGSAGSGGAPGVPLADASGVVADALCAKLEACIGTPATEFLFSDEDCRMATTKVVENTIVATINENHAAYDPEAVPGCVQAFAELGCEEIGNELPVECRRIQGGLTPEGGECLRTLECESGLYCSTGSCPGTCSLPLPQGSACTSAEECGAGHTCFENTCEPLGGEGAQCLGTVLPDCLVGFVCVGRDDNAMQPGTCRPAGELFVSGEGQVCSFADPATLCQEDLSCPLISLAPRCLPRAPSGGDCQLAVPDMCPEGEYCNSTLCAPLPGAGEACAAGIVLKPTCQAYLRCISGTCRRLGDIGNTCVLNEECYSGTCFDGVCVAPRCL